MNHQVADPKVNEAVDRFAEAPPRDAPNGTPLKQLIRRNQQHAVPNEPEAFAQVTDDVAEIFVGTAKATATQVRR